MSKEWVKAVAEQYGIKLPQWMKPCIEAHGCMAAGICAHARDHELLADCMDRQKDRVVGHCPKCVPEGRKP